MKLLLIFAFLIIQYNISGVLLNLTDHHLYMKLRSGRVIQSYDNHIDTTPHQLHPVSYSRLTNNVTTKFTTDSNTAINSPIEKRGCCITCHKQLDTNPVYTNKLTGQKFRVTENLSCKTTGIVYVTRCAPTNCSMQYVG